MRVVIHVGMHKTGSSSIQNTLAKHDNPSLKHLDWESPNHCGLFVLLFQDEDKLADYHGFRARGPEFLNQLPQMRQKWLKITHSALQAAVGKTVILSAEDISSPIFHNATQRMLEFFSQYSSDISAIGYVRSPRSFVNSAFPQVLKDTDYKTLDLTPFWPRYRTSFEPILEAFGPENVTLKRYHPADLYDGNVVLDIFQQLGLQPPSERPEKANQALSLEATALLFTQRCLGDGYVQGFPGAQRGNNLFIAGLQSIGSQKFAFSETWLQSYIQNSLDDIHWMEKILGKPLLDDIPDLPNKVDSKEMLFEIAERSQNELETILINHISNRTGPKRQRVVRMLDLLRKGSYR
ncbi:MAG: hypothetical protein ABJO67_17345 [Pseudoruegeria sp.]